jgi:peptidoglycan/LPS O-acetylase OafA/YrhL
MGLIRVLLALSVVFSHTWTGSGTGPLPGGPIAVQCFFMISGFYMSLILGSDRYREQPVKFWLNRGLRLYPVYWLLAAASFANTFLVAPEIISAFWALGLKPVLLLCFANVFLFGQDLIFWLGTKGGELFWTSSAWSLPEPRLQNYVLIGPAWSLSIELMFYLIAPWVVKWTSRTLVLLVVASLVARHVAYAAGLTFMPWTYMFFPFELAFFLLGVLAHRRLESAKSSMTAFAVVCAGILIYQHVPLVEVKVQTVAVLRWVSCRIRSTSRTWSSSPYFRLTGSVATSS